MAKPWCTPAVLPGYLASRSSSAMLSGGALGALLTAGVSANRLYGFNPFNLQNTSRGRDAEHRSSTDHLSHLEEERGWNGEAQRLGGLQVDDQLEGHCLLHGEIGGFSALQNLIDIDNDTPDSLKLTGSIGHEATRHHEILVRVDCWQPVPACEGDNALGCKERTVRDEERLSAVPSRGLKGRL